MKIIKQCAPSRSRLLIGAAWVGLWLRLWAIRGVCRLMLHLVLLLSLCKSVVQTLLLRKEALPSGCSCARHRKHRCASLNTCHTSWLSIRQRLCLRVRPGNNSCWRRVSQRWLVLQLQLVWGLERFTDARCNKWLLLHILIWSVTHETGVTVGRLLGYSSSPDCAVSRAILSSEATDID